MLCLVCLDLWALWMSAARRVLQGGFIWLFYGSHQLPVDERPPIPLVPELEDPAWKPVRTPAVLTKHGRVPAVPAVYFCNVSSAWPPVPGLCL